MKILIIGLGSIGKKHVKALNSLELQSDIYAFRSSKTGENLAGVKNIYSWEDIDASFELAIISNPTSLHAEIIEKILPFNIPLFIEKPVLLSPEKGYSLLYEVEYR
ncbi:MAG: Gfo/Idh/MocA family oxidoreductase, partial [Bacteroidota bacterium]